MVVLLLSNKWKMSKLSFEYCLLYYLEVDLMQDRSLVGKIYSLLKASLKILRLLCHIYTSLS